MRHGIGWILGSLNHGSVSMTALQYIMTSSRVRAMGPCTERTASWPGIPALKSKFGRRPLEGRMVKRPVVEAGIRSEPPISVPTPRGLPYAAISADSPPEEPPGVKLRLRGLTVLELS